MSTVPRSATICPSALSMLMLLVSPLIPAVTLFVLAPGGVPARIVIFPPGPGAAASSRDNNCAVLPMLIAIPVVLVLVMLIFPPLALRRIGGSGGVWSGTGSSEET